MRKYAWGTLTLSCSRTIKSMEQEYDLLIYQQLIYQETIENVTAHAEKTSGYFRTLLSPAWAMSITDTTSDGTLGQLHTLHPAK